MPNARATVTIVVAVEVAVAALLLPAARARPVPVRHLVGWLDSAPIDHIVVSSVTWAGVLVAGWLLATTTLGLALAAAESAGPVRAVLARVTPATVRRLCAAAIAPSLAVTPLPATGLEAPLPPPIEVPSDRAADGGLIQMPATTDEPGPSPGAADSRDEAPASTPDPVEPGPVDTANGQAVTVAPGDNLWLITARYLAAERGVPCEQLPDADIAVVWRRVIRENLPQLRSGDPDLVFPGESVVLPPG